MLPAQEYRTHVENFAVRLLLVQIQCTHVQQRKTVNHELKSGDQSVYLIYTT